MIKRQQIEERLKLLRKQHQTDYDLGQISCLLWILENWDWEVEKAQLESRLKVTGVQNNKGPVHL